MSFRGELWTVSESARKEFGLQWIRQGRREGFCNEPDAINGGGNSGFQALHLAATFGASRIILLGYDMQRTGGKKHWHGDHRGNLRNGSGFASWIKQMRPLANDLKKRGVEVINCTRHTALTCFKQQSLEEVLCGLISEEKEKSTENLNDQEHLNTEMFSSQAQEVQ